ncbi:MAG: DJ-1/PfpI family protein [Sphingopyxis sp.]|uniref:DJ-1/PfpI family protein n=1 Tax=Sphingopyxis sp. TaxID=1908224 RepID=UPI002ABA0B13|nr:DJ-1/PfpI family protein [Sphingopyxis sp.]MDZ3832844.1 DJ-1/PfpI family protein [Sphingopyxis sp.]
MTSGFDALPGASRRGFLTGAVAGAALAAGVSGAQGRSHGDAPAQVEGGGAKEGVAARPVIALLVHPAMVLQDLVGPLTVFNMMRADIHLVWRDLAPVSNDLGIFVTPTTRFADCPHDLDILFVPGGLEGSIAMMGDADVLSFLADRGGRARYVTSDCTGSLVLGAAGLLRGYRATSHWTVRDELALFGAIPSADRVVQDRNRLTGGGVTAGIDFGLTLAALIRGEEAAQRIQLVIEYAPAPPFDAGTPETAPPAIREAVEAARRPAVLRARAQAAAVVAGWAAGGGGASVQ